MRRTGAHQRVLIATAGMGGGHLQVSRELQRRLEARGHIVEVLDINDLMPGRTGGLMARGYPLMVNHAPWLYDLIFRVFFCARQRKGERAWPASRSAVPGLRKAIAAFRPDVVVSTYHIASLALGQLRERGELTVPAVTFVTTFGVHELWMHPATDAYLTICEPVAETIRERTDRPVSVTGPLVRERFLDPGVDREALRRQMRQELGIAPNAHVAVLVAGSLGMGDVVRAQQVLLDSLDWTPVVVCGRNDALARQLVPDRGGVVLGWVDDMAALLAAADVLVDNAGGLSAKEALAFGRPVLTFRPIAGHGRADAEAMAELGVTEVITDDEALRTALARYAHPSPARAARIERGAALFTGDHAEVVEAIATGTDLSTARPSVSSGQGAA